MSTKRVLLIQSGQFIGGVIHNLFERQEQLRVTVSAPSNSQELLSAVASDRPDIVVIDDTVDANFLGQLLHYMQVCEGMQVVVVNTDSNRLTIYNKQQVNLTATADLFAML